MNILIIQTAFPGDVILATAFVADLSDRYPEAQLHMVVRRGCEDILADNPRIHRVFVWDKGHQRNRNLFRLSNELRNIGYDRVYNLQRYASSGFLTWRTGSPIRVGYSSNPLSIAFHESVKHRIPHPHETGFLHEVQRNRLLLDDQILPPRRPELYFTDVERLRATELVDSNPVVVIAPASNWFTKQWHEEGWSALIASIPPEISIFIVGGKEDVALGERLRGQNKQVTNLCGKLRFRETAALMEQAWHVFTNDSAPLHLASAVNAPTTAIFCSTIPQFGFGPLADYSRIVRSSIACCSHGLHGARSCKEGHFSCSRSISEQQVLGSLPELWKAALELRKGSARTLSTMDGFIMGVMATNKEAIEGLQVLHQPVHRDCYCLLMADKTMLEQYFSSVPAMVNRLFDCSSRGPVNILLNGLRNLPAVTSFMRSLESINRNSSNSSETEEAYVDIEVAVSIPESLKLRVLVRCVGFPLFTARSNAMGEPTETEKGDVALASSLVRCTHSGLKLIREGNGVNELMPWVIPS